MKKKCENYSNLTIKTPERLSNLFIVNFGHNLVCYGVVIRIGRFPVSEAVSQRMAQSWPWGSQIAVKKKKFTPFSTVLLLTLNK